MEQESQETMPQNDFTAITSQPQQVQEGINPNPEPKVADPEYFHGDRRQSQNFLFQLHIVFVSQPIRYANHTAKVAYAASRLRGVAFTWIATYLQRNDTKVLDNYDNFCKEFNQAFGDHDASQTQVQKLVELQQRARPVSSYTAEFLRLSGNLNWNEEALCALYYKGLNGNIKDELCTKDRPTTLASLSEMAIRFDVRLYERKTERERDYRRQNVPNRNPSYSKQSGPTPMEIDMVTPHDSPPTFADNNAKKTPLSPEERKRRIEHRLCLYCGKPGHIISSCPNRPQHTNGQTIAHTTNYKNHLHNGQNHLLLPVTIHTRSQDIETHALLDTGAHSCFISETFVRNHNITTHPKSIPIAIYGVNGQEMIDSRVTMETEPLTLTVNGIPEPAILNVLPNSQHPLILGAPWCQRHDPLTISWKNQTVATPPTTYHGIPSNNHQSHLMTVNTITTNQTTNTPLETINEEESSSFLPTPPQTPINDIDDPLDAAVIPHKYQSMATVFSEEEANILPEHRKYDMEIKLHKNTNPPWGPIYNLSENELKVLREYIDDNLAKGFIRHSQSPAGAPILFVKKKDDSLRLCVDYRGLNSVTIKNRYPLPLIPEMIDQLKHATVFTKIDLRGAYNLVRIKPGDEWKTAFRTRYGHFEYNVMPFGLSNAPATFQHMINDIFRDMLDNFVIAYLDDILIFSATQQQHNQHVSQVLQRLKDHHLYAKLEKCSFDQHKVEFLGHIISPKGIGMDDSKVTAIRQWSSPNSVKELQVFLGFANYYRKFIANYSKIALPMTTLLSTKSKQPWFWTEAAQSAFDSLKNQFCSAPILQHPDPAHPFTLETDASDFALGAVLFQTGHNDSHPHPVAFYSRKLTAPEINYEIYDKELLAIVEALQQWRHLLIGSSHPVTIHSDHKNLEYFTTTRRLNRRQARWSIFLADFNFTITYRPGRLQGQPDALSRQPALKPKEGDGIYDIQEQTLLQPKHFIFMTSDPPIINRIKEAYPSDSLAQSLLASQEDDPTITIRNELIYKHNKVYIPKSLRNEVLHSRHDAKLAGHFGISRTTKLTNRDYWWPQIKNHVRDYIKTCETCNRAKTSHTQKTGPLQPLPIPEQAWSSISMDFITDLPNSSGSDSILVVVDRLTKMGHFIPCNKTITAKVTADLYIKNIVRLHGIPRNIVSDRGTQFTSRFWTAFHQVLGTTLSLSTAFHPETDGQTERLNQVLEQYLRCYTNYAQDDWSQLLPFAEFAYNNSVHSATKQSPFYANYGFHPAIDIHLSNPTDTPAAEDKAEQIQEIITQLKENMKSAQSAYTEAANKHRKPVPDYQIGDKVWLRTTNLKTNRPNKKLDHRKLGPFSILQQINPVAFKIELPSTMKIHNVFHASLLEPTTTNELSERYQPPPEHVTVDNEIEYEVEKIVDHKTHYRKTKYLVQWKGYGPEDNTWEPIENLEIPGQPQNKPLQDYLRSISKNSRHSTNA